MKSTFLFVLALSIQYESNAQTQQPPKLYSHKVVVDSVLQTKAYTYLKVREQINERDSVQWMAMPLFEPKSGDTYYYERGLQMGEFQSKELNRTFDQILFLGGLSTTAEMNSKTIVPAPVMDTIPADASPVTIRSVVVKEVIQTSGYTYLRVVEDGKEEWLAVVKIRAYAGQTFTYEDAAPMTDFKSKELNRTFKEVLFISKLTLNTDPEMSGTKEKDTHRANNKTNSQSGKTVLKKQIHIEPVEGCISVADLMEKKKLYAGKTVRIKGEVTKFSSDILSRNWIHIQDGTEFSGKYDLVITTNQVAKEGDIIIFDGKVNLNRDFGSGYFFDVILEEAKIEAK